MEENITQWFNENRWLNLIFFILTVLSIIVSFYLYFKNKRKKILVYFVKTFNLIKDRVNKVQEIKIIYLDNPIKNLSITKISLWNKGNEIINKTDIAPIDPIRIVVDDEYEILNANIIFTKKEANNFSITITPDKKSVVVDFDYIYTTEGISLEIYHTGVSGKDIKLKGTIKGAPQFEIADFNAEDFIFDYVCIPFDILGNKLCGDKVWKHYIYFMCISPIIFPIALLVKPIESLYGWTKKTKIPSEYSLEDE